MLWKMYFWTLINVSHFKRHCFNTSVLNVDPRAGVDKRCGQRTTLDFTLSECVVVKHTKLPEKKTPPKKTVAMQCLFYLTPLVTAIKLFGIDVCSIAMWTRLNELHVAPRITLWALFLCLFTHAVQISPVASGLSTKHTIAYLSSEQQMINVIYPGLRLDNSSTIHPLIG